MENRAANVELHRSTTESIKLHCQLSMLHVQRYDDFLATLKDHRKALTKVVSCFTDNRQAPPPYLQRDSYIGVSGWIYDYGKVADCLDQCERFHYIRQCWRPKPLTFYH